MEILVQNPQNGPKLAYYEKALGCWTRKYIVLPMQQLGPSRIFSIQTLQTLHIFFCAETFKQMKKNSSVTSYVCNFFLEKANSCTYHFSLDFSCTGTEKQMKKNPAY